MKRARLLVTLSMLVAVPACSHASRTAPQNEDPVGVPASRGRPLVIGAFKTHDAKVSIVGGRGGSELRVIVRKDDGTVVAENATLDELRAKDPDTWRILESALAQLPGTSLGTSPATYLDATLDARPTHDRR